MAAKSRSAPADAGPLGGVTLVVGAEDLLVDRAVAAAVVAVRSADADAEMSELDAADLSPGGLAELTSPSLFATSRIVVVRALDGLSAETVPTLLAYAKSPEPDIALVLVHRGGQKGRATVDKLRKGGVRVVACDPL